jgi:hypothetical protein
MENPDQLEIVDGVPGVQKVLDWIGHWPSFHDSEIVWVEEQIATCGKRRRA